MPAIVATSLVLALLIIPVILLGTTAPSVDTLIEAGAKVNARIAAGEWWRFASAGLLHASLPHLLLNSVMLGFAVLAWVSLVRDEGWSRVVLALTLVVLTSTLGFVASFVVGAAPSVGASAAANGMLAAIVTGVWARRDALPERVRTSAPWALTAAFVVVVAFSLTTGVADHAAHIGGALAGALLGYLVDGVPRTRGIVVALALAVVVISVVRCAAT